MISWVSVRLRWVRRKASRSHWAARLMGIPLPIGESEHPGLIMIQIDGLSRTQLERAVHEGNMPFLRRLIDRGHFTLETFYSGVPSTTPAVQGEVFFGVKQAVPAFQFLRRKENHVLRMYEAAAAQEIEKDLRAKCADPLLESGHSYSNIYRAGAERSRYCAQDFAPDEILRHLHPLRGLVLCIVYLPKILRMIGLAVLEFVLAIVDAVKGLYKRENFMKEMGFIPARVMVCIVLRELIRFRILLDIERGVQTIHANFLGYDEQAHRRGPDSSFAHWTLLGIDRAIRDIYRAASHSDHRDYELLLYSDHGQEHSEPFPRRHGRSLESAVREVFSNGPLADREVWIRKIPELVGDTLDRFRHLFGLEPASAEIGGVPDPKNEIIITAMGPLGHLYLPIQIEAADMERYARDLVTNGGIPLILFHSANEGVRAFNNRGDWVLPRDQAEVLGENHPFLHEAADDLVQLFDHPDVGDFVISGWDPQQMPLTFPSENGAHGGPGSEETRGFLLVPDRIRRWHVAHLAHTRTRVRGEDLRKIALHYLQRDGIREERVHIPSPRQDLPLRVMTYNIHSCIGLDGKLRPERVARVINCCDPDVVAVQEVDAHRLRSGGHHQAELIADHLRMTHVFHTMLEEEREKYGIAIFARAPFEIVKAGLLTQKGPQRLQEARGAIWVQLEMEGHRPFHFVNTHFGLGRQERRLQTEELLGNEWLGSVAEDEPVILCGDFNSSPRSWVCQRLLQRFLDAQHAATGHKPRATFSSVAPFLRIDHIFVSRHFKIDRVELPNSPTAIVASDHRPLCVELTLHD